MILSEEMKSVENQNEMKLINKEKEQQQLILIICSTKTY
jgi:hypothetical protein